VVEFCWDNFLWLQIYEEAGTAKHEAVVKSFMKCGISNAADDTEDDVPFEESEALDSNNSNDVYK
jgi:hypothetical protein